MKKSVNHKLFTIPGGIALALMAILSAGLISGCAGTASKAGNGTQAAAGQAQEGNSMGNSVEGTGTGPAGEWTGDITIGSAKLGITARIVAGDALSGELDIPQQNAFNLPLSDFVWNEPALSFTLTTKPPARFEGSVSGNTCSGTFSQGAARGTFTLVRSAAGGTPAMAGGPKSGTAAGGGASGGAASAALDPGETVVFIPVEKGRIEGTLRIPAGSGPWPVVLIIAGSGPTDRNGNSPLLPGRNDSLKLIAMELEKAGIASLRYDKRGIAASAGAGASEQDLRFGTYIHDVILWVDFLKERDEFSSIGILGHSEGSLIGAAAALSAAGDVACFVSVAGAGRPADQILKEQLASSPPADRDLMYRYIDELRAGKTIDDVPEPLYSLFRPSVQPYLISWFAYDPAKVVASLRIPVLVVQGTTDLQVSVKDSELLAPKGSGRELLLIQGMNHVLKTAPLDREKNIAAYSDPSLPLNPDFAAGLVAFLRKSLF